MVNSIDEHSFLTQKVKIKKRFSNKEIKLYNFFYQKTNIFPKNVIAFNSFIFFFVKSESYFKAKRYLNSIRNQLLDKKILIVRAETTLIKLLFSFFPDLYIHDVSIDITKTTVERVINVDFLLFKERGIAIGRGGSYIKIINKIFKKYIWLESNNIPIEIKCNIIDLKRPKN